MLDRIRLFARTDRRFLLVGAALVLMLLLDLSLLAADYLQRSGIESKKAQVRAGTVKLNALRVSTENAAAVLGKSRQINALAGRLGRSVAQSDIVSSIFDLAARTGIRVRDQNFIRSENGEERTDMAFLAQTLVISGKYRQVRAFLKKVEDNDEGLSVVERAEFSTAEGDEVVARIKLVTYGGAPADE